MILLVSMLQQYALAHGCARLWHVLLLRLLLCPKLLLEPLPCYAILESFSA